MNNFIFENLQLRFCQSRIKRPDGMFWFKVAGGGKVVLRDPVMVFRKDLYCRILLYKSLSFVSIIIFTVLLLFLLSELKVVVMSFSLEFHLYIYIKMTVLLQRTRLTFLLMKWFNQTILFHHTLSIHTQIFPLFNIIMSNLSFI